MTCQYAAGALSNVPGGMLVDVWGKKGQLMALSLFWVGFPYLMMGFSSQYWMLLICVMLVGIGNNLWHPTAIPLLGGMFPKRKGLALSLHGMGGNVGEQCLAGHKQRALVAQDARGKRWHGARRIAKAGH